MPSPNSRSRPNSTSAALYRRTGGNPFFVTEVLASPQDTIPETVRDAVLARSAGLSAGARRLLGVVAVARHTRTYRSWRN